MQNLAAQARVPGHGLRLRPEQLRLAVPIVAMLAMVALCVLLQPQVLSYFGLTLLLRYSMPLLFATMAQLCILTVGDIDLSIGPFMSLVNCIAATWLEERPVLGSASLLSCILAYAGMGALIQVRRLPSIVVTLGVSFVWLGIALLLSPTPGGSVPDWLVNAVGFRTPLIPMPIVVAGLLGGVGHILLMRTSYGVILRGLGSNAAAIERAGWSALTGRVVLYGVGGMCGVAAGLCLAGLITTGDALVGAQYTLLSIAGAIIGGAEFSGGIVSPIGAAFGAIIMLLSGSLLSFLNVSTDWQLSVQGGLLTLVLALRTIAAWVG